MIGIGFLGLAMARQPGATRAPGVNSPIVAAISPSSGTVGDTFTASSTGDLGSPAGALTYQWKLGGVNISGATASTYQVAAAGSLTVAITATNASGSSSDTSDAVTVSSSPPGGPSLDFSNSTNSQYLALIMEDI